MKLKGFNNWEKQSLSLIEEGNLEILLSFIEQEDKDDFLHNLADIIFSLKENLTKHNSRKIQSAKTKVTILDNNPLSIAKYMEEHPDVDL